MERVVADPAVCSGKPVIKGTRVLVRNILSLISAGQSFDEIRVAYPSLTDEDISAAVHYASELVDEVRLVSGAN